MDETMEAMEAAAASLWDGAEEPLDAGAEGPEADQPKEEPARQEPGGAREEPGGGGQPADQPELFTIKNRDETRQVTREELVSMAQKGWDYDRVRSERDQLRQYRQDADPALELVRGYAQRSGMSVSDYLDYCRKQELMAAGMSERDAAQKVSFDRERAELDRQRKTLQDQQAQADSARRRAQERAQARQRDIESFYRAYPKVDPKGIPQEVWAAVRGGDTLTNAYTMYENRRLQTALEAERQNRENRAKSPGSMGGASADDNASLIAKYWDEAD